MYRMPRLLAVVPRLTSPSRVLVVLVTVLNWVMFTNLHVLLDEHFHFEGRASRPLLLFYLYSYSALVRAYLCVFER